MTFVFLHSIITTEQEKVYVDIPNGKEEKLRRRIIIVLLKTNHFLFEGEHELL
jgi:hypothetical protein